MIRLTRLRERERERVRMREDKKEKVKSGLGNKSPVCQAIVFSSRESRDCIFVQIHEHTHTHIRTYTYTLFNTRTPIPGVTVFVLARNKCGEKNR